MRWCPRCRPTVALLAVSSAVLLGTGCEEPGAVDPPKTLSPRELDRRGDAHLKAGRFAQAIVDFDAFLRVEPSFEAQHWRRGIAYYYAGRYESGVRQFELHRNVNKNDVENAVWHFLCKAKLEGVDAARAALLPVGPDRRVPMMLVYEMFAGRSTPTAVERAARMAAAGPQAESALFYAHLYIGLHHVAMGIVPGARHHIDLAAKTHKSQHYMGDIARMHARLLAH